MIAALALGTGAAVLWGGAALLSAPAARLAGPARAFFWTSAAATATALPFALAEGLPTGDASDWLLVLTAGVAYTGATGLWMLAVSAGQVSVVVPIIASDGALSAVLAALTGASFPATVALALAVMVLGIILVTAGAANDSAEDLPFTSSPPRAVNTTVAMALTAAVLFGWVFYASGKATGMPPAWVVAISRAIPTMCALPLCLAAGAVRPPARSWRFIVTYGMGDAGGYLLYVRGAAAGLAVASVSASQYAAVAAIGAVVVFKERLLRPQVAGIGLLVLSTAVIGARG
jgi:drug/metabolite transporter (DMT)-like permease